MKALILNSGIGSRMGDISKEIPKALNKVSDKETILSNQLKLIEASRIKEVIITTGFFHNKIIEYVNSLNLNINYSFVKNPIYDKTNSIYSVYLARKFIEDDILFLHGDLVFQKEVLDKILDKEESCAAISTTMPLPQKDFKGKIVNNKIVEISVDCFENAYALQPIYKVKKKDWLIWLEKIQQFCDSNNTDCYAENAFNCISDKCILRPVDIENNLCGEVDTLEDLKMIKEKINKLNLNL